MSMSSLAAGTVREFDAVTAVGVAVAAMARLLGRGWKIIRAVGRDVVIDLDDPDEAWLLLPMKEARDPQHAVQVVDDLVAAVAREERHLLCLELVETDAVDLPVHVPVTG